MPDIKRRKKSCEITVESEPRDVNRTGYEEEPAKYMADPVKGFLKSIKRLFKKEV